MLPVTFITDCFDSNASMRLQTRTEALLGTTAQIYPVNLEIEASFNTIDAIDAADSEPSVVLVNVAPRSGEARKYGNGYSFCAFMVAKTLVVSTTGSKRLSLFRKLDLVEDVLLFDTVSVAQWARQRNFFDDAKTSRVVETQFRGFEFLPRLAKWLVHHANPPHKTVPIAEIVPDDCLPNPKSAAWVDNFGNIKTCALPVEIGFQPGRTLKMCPKYDRIPWGEFGCYLRLADVPDGLPGFVIGSSGIGDHRFVELVIQGGNAAAMFNIRSGDLVLD